MAQPLTGHDPNETVVFKDDKYDFRIPALVYIKELNTFLAFAEKRKLHNGTSRDADTKNLVMSRGTRQPSGTLQWSTPKDLKKAVKRGYRTMNPCPVFETSTQTLFLFFICIKGKIKESDLIPGQTCLCYVTTTDAGETWSKRQNVTEEIDGINLKKDYNTFAVGPGHGIEAEGDHPGSPSTGATQARKRLLIPAHAKDKGSKSHALVLYSDDAGHKWCAGKQLTQESGECQVAEVLVAESKEFYLYCNARTFGSRDKCGLRQEAQSDNMGESFTKLKHLCLTETPHGCHGSVLGFLAPDKRSTWLLFSHPTSGPEPGEKDDYIRRDLGVRLRKSLHDCMHEDCHHWGDPYIIHRGKGGYSDLTACEEEGRFACLMECEELTRKRIVYKEFSLNDLK